MASAGIQRTKKKFLHGRVAGSASLKTESGLNKVTKQL